MRKRLRDGAGAAIQLPHPKRGWADGIDVAITDGVNVDVAEEKEEEEEEVEEEEEEEVVEKEEEEAESALRSVGCGEEADAVTVGAVAQVRVVVEGEEQEETLAGEEEEEEVSATLPLMGCRDESAANASAVAGLSIPAGGVLLIPVGGCGD